MTCKEKRGKIGKYHLIICGKLFSNNLRESVCVVKSQLFQRRCILCSYLVNIAKIQKLSSKHMRLFKCSEYKYFVETLCLTHLFPLAWISMQLFALYTWGRILFNRINKDFGIFCILLLSFVTDDLLYFGLAFYLLNYIL